MKMRSTLPLSLVVVGLAFALGCGESEEDESNGDEPWDEGFVEVANLVQVTCAIPSCHGSTSSVSTSLEFGADGSDLEFAAIADVLLSYESGIPLVAPGDPEGSLLYQAVTSDVPAARMPPDPMPPLEEAQVELIRAWIAADAPTAR